MTAKNLVYKFKQASEMPPPSEYGGNRRPSKWQGLRDLMFKMQVGGAALRVRLETRKEARLCRSAAQNMCSTKSKVSGRRSHRAGQLLPPEVNVVTRAVPVDPQNANGEWYLWVKLTFKGNEAQ